MVLPVVLLPAAAAMGPQAVAAMARQAAVGSVVLPVRHQAAVGSVVLPVVRRQAATAAVDSVVLPVAPLPLDSEAHLKVVLVRPLQGSVRLAECRCRVQTSTPRCRSSRASCRS